MRKSKFIIAIIMPVIWSLTVFAQNTGLPVQNTGLQVYVKVYGAYGFLSPGSFRGEASKPLTSDTNFFKVTKKGMGQGIRMGGGFGFILSDYVNVGIDGEYLKGSTIEVPINQSYQKTTVNSLTTINHTLVSIIPNITFKAVSTPTYHIYTRLGIIIGIPLDITQDYRYDYLSFLSDDPPLRRKVHNVTTIYHAEYKLEKGIGYQAAIGIQVEISGKLRGFLEISGYRLTLNRIKYEEITKSRRDITGREDMIDAIFSPPDQSRNIIYYKSAGSTRSERQGSDNNYVYTYTNPQDPINLNAVTAGIGIFYRF